jgi:hypothetical protein
MNEKANVLIFPAGSENAIEIYNSLKYNLHFTVFGASGKRDHSEFIYPKERLFIGDLYISQPNFLNEMNKVIEKFRIDFIIPTHDAVASFLTKNVDKINANIICSPYETAKIAESKKLTYEYLKDFYFCPKIYNNFEDIDSYPVFLKPIYGAGGKGTYLIKNQEELFKFYNEDYNNEFVLMEYLPGNEYTIDCFTNKSGNLLFAGPRTRERVTMGITFRSNRVFDTKKFEEIALELNNKFKFRGAWFFQLKEDKQGNLKLMEFSVRQAGTMNFYRQLGINFAALSLFDAMGYDVKIIFNDYNLTLDRSLKNCYKLDYYYDKIYIDFDDTLIVNEKVNTTLIKLIYQCVQKNKKVILLTKHEFDIDESLHKYKISPLLFDEIIVIPLGHKKADYIDKSKAIFIDNYFQERLSVKELCNIPVFDVDAIECLIDCSSF